MASLTWAPTEDNVMPHKFNFILPPSLVEIRPYLRALNYVPPKDYLATFHFNASNQEFADAPSTPSGLQWSSTLKLPFVYIPEVTTNESGSAIAVKIAQLRPPQGARQLTIEIHPWGARTKSEAVPFAEALIETDLMAMTSLILPTRDE